MDKKILIIDDSASVRQSLSYVLTKGGYEVIEAADGLEALTLLKSVSPNLIICDVNMPNMDGISFVKTVKSDPLYESIKFIPIIMLTTESGETKRQEGREAGVRAWITKPFPPETILDAIKKLMT